MKYAVDLHIHTCLSPCADDDMTPNNIVNMALLKGLDIIGITDHNSCDNVEAVIKVAKDKLLVVPGMEVQTREEVHLLCYFKDLPTLSEFGLIIEHGLPNLLNRREIFGNQYIMDSEDSILKERKELLLSSVDMGVDEVVSRVRAMEGVVVPAHVDRRSFSLISQLGFISENLNFSTLEIENFHSLNRLNLQEYKYIMSSDAHSLGDILERESFIELDSLGVYDLLSRLENNK